MKRFSIFCLIGPLVGFALLMTIGVYVTHRPIASLAAGIPFTYLLGIVPALICAVADWKLERLNSAERAGIVFCVGYVATVLVGAFLFKGMQVTVFAAFGAVPAAVCSLLSSVKLRWPAQ